MKNVKSLNIWKQESPQDKNDEFYFQMDISDLGLSVRSYNCLKRANCNTVQDVLNCIGEDGLGLKRIRNLGTRSESEIIEKLQDIKEKCMEMNPAVYINKRRIIRPSVRIWDKDIDEFPLSEAARNRFESCGIQKINDLYAGNRTNDPGWYAVRELFSKIPNYR